MYWISIDPASVMGVAVWNGDKLFTSYVVRKYGAKGRWKFGNDIVPSRREAMLEVVRKHGLVIVEEGFGRFTSAVKHQAELRGYLRAVCDSFGAQMRVINVSEWRRVISEHYDVRWPAKSAEKKRAAVLLVNELFGRLVTHDEADAILLGRAAVLMRHNVLTI